MEENKNKQEEMENRAAVELTEQEERSVTGGVMKKGDGIKCKHCGSPVEFYDVKCWKCGKNPKG